jgi:hypothetical protein
VELRLRTRDGAWLDTETVVNPLLDDEEVGGLVLTTRDVTMRKQLEAEHAERERVRDVFARFVPAAVVEQLLERGDLQLRLGGDTLHPPSCSPTCAGSRASRRRCPRRR